MRYSGKIGFGFSTEIDPGVWEDVIEEHQYYGEWYKISRRNQPSQDTTNDTLTISNEISIVCDPFANNHLNDIRYITFMGNRYKVSNIQVSIPRLILSIGDIYNGPIPEEEGKTS